MTRLGLVQFLNARPLDQGFRERAAAGEDIELSEDTPAELFRRLQAGELDAALISSVECLRNAERLGFCEAVGVAARWQVRSILYIRPLASEERGSPDDPAERPATLKDDGPAARGTPVECIYADSASRSSIALLECLYARERGALPQVETLPAAEIPRRCLDEARAGRSVGGLLIGDNALDFSQGEQRDRFAAHDLASWWREREELPFVFALWAYPRKRPLPDAFFLESLERGLAQLADIAGESSYPGAQEYLGELLHYRLDAADRAGLARFRERLISIDRLQPRP